jgi:phage terminase large subunit-like protein
MQQAVQRHVDDLEKDDWPYFFDRQKANQALEAFPVLFQHTQGKFNGAPFVLSPFAAFGIGSIFGWRCCDGTRRYRRAYWSTGRKTGKSMVAMGIAILMARYDGEAQAQVWLGATKRDQAKKIIFAEAQRQCRRSPPLKSDAVVQVLQIKFGDSFIEPVGSDKPFDGLFPSCVIFDEIHAWKPQHQGFYDTLTTGFGSRLQPLRFTITTAGDANSFIWKEEIDHARLVLNREFEEESYFVLIAELDKDDDIFDESNWVKAMPNLGQCTPYETIRELAREAERSPKAKNRFIRYFANREVSSAEQAIDPALWDECESELSNWNTADVVCGAMDAGGRNDMGATAMVARFADGMDDTGEQNWRYECKVRCYMDAETTRDLTELPWLTWVDREKLRVVPYVFTAMQDDLTFDMQEFNGRQVGFDPWATQVIAENMQQQGFECVKIQQTRYNLHEPLDLFLDLVRKKKLNHDGTQPILRWAIGNLVINADSNDRWLPDRKQSADKIDPVVAIIMALRLASLAPPRPKGPAVIFA